VLVNCAVSEGDSTWSDPDSRNTRI